MQQSKGIKLKSKQTSIVQNVVDFLKSFKTKEQKSQQKQPEDCNVSRDLSNCSKTPRKKIFDKTPEKAGKLKLDNNNNKSFDNGRNKGQFYPGNRQQLIRNGSPRQVNITRLSDQFFKQDTSRKNSPLRPHNTKIKQKQPTKFYLSEQNHENTQMNQKSMSNHSRLDYTNQIKMMQKQLDRQKKIIFELEKQNNQLKRHNQSLLKQNQNIKRHLKMMEKAQKAQGNNVKQVEILQLEGPKSPFEKKSQKNINKNQKVSPLNSSNEGNILFEGDEDFFAQIKPSSPKPTNQSGQFMKQSIPIVPQVPKEFGQSGYHKVQQMSLKSMNMKSISQNNSFLSQQPFSQQSSFQIHNASFNKEKSSSQLSNKKNKQKNLQNQKQQMQFLSPLGERTVYEKTMKPGHRNKSKGKGLQEGKKRDKGGKFEEQDRGAVSKTVGYLKGDIKVQHKTKQQKRDMNVRSNNNNKKQQLDILAKNNPFQQISTQSNKFFFQQQPIHSPKSKNPNNQITNLSPPRTNPPFTMQSPQRTRQWLQFDQSSQLNSLTYSPSQKNSINNSRNPFNKSKLDSVSRVKSPIGRDNSFKKSRSNNQMGSISRVGQSKSYRFADFNINQEESCVDYF